MWTRLKFFYPQCFNVVQKVRANKAITSTPLFRQNTNFGKLDFRIGCNHARTRPSRLQHYTIPQTRYIANGPSRSIKTRIVHNQSPSCLNQDARIFPKIENSTVGNAHFRINRERPVHHVHPSVDQIDVGLSGMWGKHRGGRNIVEIIGTVVAVSIGTALCLSLNYPPTKLGKIRQKKYVFSC